MLGGGKGAGGAMAPPIFFEMVEFSEILMFLRKIFVILLLVKIRGFEFYGKVFGLGSPTLQVPRRP